MRHLQAGVVVVGAAAVALQVGAEEEVEREGPPVEGQGVSWEGQVGTLAGEEACQEVGWGEVEDANAIADHKMHCVADSGMHSLVSWEWEEAHAGVGGGNHPSQGGCLPSRMAICWDRSPAESATDVGEPLEAGQLCAIHICLSHMAETCVHPLFVGYHLHNDGAGRVWWDACRAGPSPNGLAQASLRHVV